MVIFQSFLFWQAVQHKNQIVEVWLECHGALELQRRSGGKWKLLTVTTDHFCLFCFVLFCSIMAFVAVKRR